MEDEIVTNIHPVDFSQSAEDDNDNDIFYDAYETIPPLGDNEFIQNESSVTNDDQQNNDEQQKNDDQKRGAEEDNDNDIFYDTYETIPPLGDNEFGQNESSQDEDSYSESSSSSEESPYKEPYEEPYKEPYEEPIQRLNTKPKTQRTTLEIRLDKERVKFSLFDIERTQLLLVTHMSVLSEMLRRETSRLFLRRGTSPKVPHSEPIVQETERPMVERAEQPEAQTVERAEVAVDTEPQSVPTVEKVEAAVQMARHSRRRSLKCRMRALFCCCGCRCCRCCRRDT